MMNIVILFISLLVGNTFESIPVPYLACSSVETYRSEPAGQKHWRCVAMEYRTRGARELGEQSGEFIGVSANCWG